MVISSYCSSDYGEGFVIVSTLQWLKGLVKRSLGRRPCCQTVVAEKRIQQHVPAFYRDTFLFIDFLFLLKFAAFVISFALSFSAMKETKSLQHEGGNTVSGHSINIFSPLYVHALV